MRQCVIHDGATFRVTSFGNGLSYDLRHKIGNRAVFFQGDDAARFHDEFEQWASLNGATYESAAFNLWIDYACISEPCEATI